MVALAGDGGLLYTVQEMATAADEGVSIIVVLWNNEALAEIRDGFVSRGITPIATSPGTPDYRGLAESFGWQTRRIADLAQLRSAVLEALGCAKPTLLELAESDPF